MDTKHNLKCDRCGHGWETESRAWLLSCPSCGKKVRNTEKWEDDNDNSL